MTDAAREHIREWLRDAHALEEQAEQLFSGQAEKLGDYPEIQEKLQFEINYAIENQVLLSIRMQQLGSTKSLIKDMSAKLFATIQNLSGLIASDEPVKAVLALHTFTQMAIGSYQILIAAALQLNDEETLNLCKKILSYAQSRAHWIEDELASVTRSFILSDQTST